MIFPFYDGPMLIPFETKNVSTKSLLSLVQTVAPGISTGMHCKSFLHYCFALLLQSFTSQWVTLLNGSNQISALKFEAIILISLALCLDISCIC